MPIALRQAVPVSPSDLKFDTQNPRLALDPSVTERAGEKAIIRALKDSADLGELILSIAANGYVNVEPMIVIGDNPPYRVLEGNRRLAAIKLLADPALAAELKVQLPDSDTPRIFDEILVYRVSTEEEARAYIGFKHINGPHKWDSIAKAKYAAEWFIQGNASVDEISRKIGDSFETVKKMLHGWFVLQQARQAGLFAIENRYPERQFAFSHLYVALTRRQIRAYLNLPANFSSSSIEQNPVKTSKLDQLSKLLTWIYGNKTDAKKSVIASQNPDVKRLAEVLDDPKATATLERTNNLEEAYAQLKPADEVFQEALFQAEASAKEASANVYSYSGNRALYTTATALADISKSLCESMRVKLERAEPGD